MSLIQVACTHTPPPDRSTIIKNEHNYLESVSLLSHYQINGTFAYLSSKQKIYTHFKWQQLSTGHYRLILINPIGSTDIDVNLQSDIVQIINPQGKSYVDRMINQLKEIDIPLNNLQKWIIGLPGEATDFTLNNHGYLTTLNYRYNGKIWTVSYQGYHNDTVPVLPAALELRQGDNIIKIKIYSWNIL